VAELLRHPEDYTITSLDGRALQATQGKICGAILVRKKGSREPPQLVSLVW
jgi:hypothetical protein